MKKVRRTTCTAAPVAATRFPFEIGAIANAIAVQMKPSAKT